ncbi:MAG: hypothetical protein ACLFU8_02685 [Anaerolineales bacterium]
MSADNLGGRARRENTGPDNEQQEPRFYPSPVDPSLYHYVPGTPGVQRSAAGAPQLNLVAGDDFAMLQITTEWSIDQEAFQRFRTLIAKQEDAPPAPQIRFAPAPYDVEKVTLLIADPHGELQSVATATPSGFGNNAAVFNLRLDAEQKARAIAALEGEPDLMQVVYDVNLKRTHHATTCIRGEVTEEVGDIEPGEEPEALRQRVETALDEERLTLRRHISEGASEALQEAADDAALTSAAEALRRLARERRDEDTPSLPESEREEEATEEWTIEVEETVEDQTVEHLHRVSDAAGWLPDGDTSGHLQIF